MTKPFKMSLSPTELNEILIRIAEGESTSSICRRFEMTRYHFIRFLESDTLFFQKVESARKIAAEISVEELKQIVNDAPDAARAKIISDNVKFIAKADSRQRFGEKIDIDMSATLDLTGVLAAANARALPVLNQARPSISNNPIKSSTQIGSATDLESVDADDSPESFEDLL